MYKAGQVVLVKFHPGYGSELKKYRPALILSDITSKTDPRFVLIVPLSTRKSSHQTKLEPTLPGSPFLKVRSYALLWYPLTIDQARIQTTLGTLSEKTIKKLQQQFLTAFSSVIL